jgi:hypothetical protein
MEAGSPSPADVREAQKRHWTSVADAWAKWSDWTERNFAPLTVLLRERTGWQPGAAILDWLLDSDPPSAGRSCAISSARRLTSSQPSGRG